MVMVVMMTEVVVAVVAVVPAVAAVTWTVVAVTLMHAANSLGRAPVHKRTCKECFRAAVHVSWALRHRHR